eukprot:CAMPEP_0175280670 /NCGR_PEP_ID=MMETSP0093-20121207/50691_1 /TAXON_ID=311494 /ORGANISM="Alexandrium monilatum, Strain CCMP3105" /LENGTH=55 /DNA_ID=CAMNT_0016575759 /DNA_START=52 /DNA_END=216 /DNA_ORIENTATION=-
MGFVLQACALLVASPVPQACLQLPHDLCQHDLLGIELSPEVRQGRVPLGSLALEA